MADLILQQPNLLADRRGRLAYRARGGGYAAALNDFHEEQHLGRDIHLCAPPVPFCHSGYAHLTSCEAAKTSYFCIAA